MKQLSYKFEQLCWQSGFISHYPGGNCLNKPALMDYLSVSRRTLDRWIGGERPCPRAAKLLKQRLSQLNTCWSGFYYDRHNKLGHEDWKQTYSQDEIRLFPELLKRENRHKNDSEMYKRKFNELLNVNLAKEQRAQLLSLAENLTNIANNSAYYGFMKRLAVV